MDPRARREVDLANLQHKIALPVVVPLRQLCLCNSKLVGVARVGVHPQFNRALHAQVQSQAQRGRR